MKLVAHVSSSTKSVLDPNSMACSEVRRNKKIQKVARKLDQKMLHLHKLTISGTKGITPSNHSRLLQLYRPRQTRRKYYSRWTNAPKPQTMEQGLPDNIIPSSQ
mmetsp:Transcript_20098/g.42070  ORF Transcript_20098/g.42070 Transcript_20098/m.42070 type:complete len:104 (+) Transcript_20098:1238-1549(+)